MQQNETTSGHHAVHNSPVTCLFQAPGSASSRSWKPPEGCKPLHLPRGLCFYPKCPRQACQSLVLNPQCDSFHQLRHTRWPTKIPRKCGWHARGHHIKLLMRLSGQCLQSNIPVACTGIENAFAMGYANQDVDHLMRLVQQMNSREEFIEAF